jgi:hypothetical protein
MDIQCTFASDLFLLEANILARMNSTNNAQFFKTK